MTATPLTPFLYDSLPTRYAGRAGDLPRQYLLDYVVCDYIDLIIVTPAGPATYAVTFDPRRSKRLDFSRAALDQIPGVRVRACLAHVATLFFPFAPSLEVIRDEVALAFASYDAKNYDITSDLPKYEMEMGYEIEADYHLDEAA